MGNVTCGLTGDKTGGHNAPSPLMLQDSGLSSGQSPVTQDCPHSSDLSQRHPGICLSKKTQDDQAKNKSRYEC